jgi:hypothetical protein
MDTSKLIQKLKDKNIIVFLTITGGGTGAISKLLENGGASEVFYGAHVPYSYYVSEDKPDKFVSAEYAKELAVDGWDKMTVEAARYPEIINKKNFVSVGVTSSLMKSGGDRADRVNEVYMHLIYDEAMKDTDSELVEHNTKYVNLTDNKTSRLKQEEFVTESIIRFLEDCS